MRRPPFLCTVPSLLKVEPSSVSEGAATEKVTRREAGAQSHGPQRSKMGAGYGGSSERRSGLREASFRGGALRRRRRVGRCVRGDQVAAGPDPSPPVSVPIWGI